MAASVFSSLTSHAATGFLLALFAGLRIAAQTPDPVDLAVERASFLRQVIEDSQILTEQYERALAKIEIELAAAADYEEALRVQQRRQELKALIGSNEDSAISSSIPLPPTQARLSGSTEVRDDQLTGWRSSGSAADWPDLQIPAGHYYLELEANLTETPALPGSFSPARVQPKDRVTFEFFEVLPLAGAEENRRSFEIPLSPDESQFTSVQAGPIRFTQSPLTLRLAAASAYPGNVVKLRNLRLTPVLAEASNAPVSAQPKTSILAESRKALNEAIAQAQKPVIEAYLEQLREFAANNISLKPATDMEIKRVLQLLENDLDGLSAFNRTLSFTTGMAGFEDLNGARLIDHPDNSGDRLIVEHEGRQMQLRLLWTTCAPLRSNDPASKSFARYFGLPESTLSPLARLAQEFTTHYLAEQPLRLLVHSEKDADGWQAALVFLPQVGLYQNILVDQGLAMIQSPTQQSDADDAHLQSTLLETLKEHERAARKRQAGAWALAEELKK